MGRNMYMCDTLEVILWGSGCAPPVAPCINDQLLALLFGFSPMFGSLHIS